MTKENVPVMFNDQLVGRAEFFDRDGTITITLHDPLVMPRLMSDAFHSLSIGWDEVVQLQPVIKIGDKVKSCRSGRIFDVVDVFDDAFRIKIRAHERNRGMWVNPSKYIVVK